MTFPSNFWCKKSLALLIFLFYVLLVEAQPHPDSLLQNPLDSPLIDSPSVVAIPTPKEEVFPKIGLVDFELSFEDNVITIQAQQAYQGVELPNRFVSDFEWKGHKEELLFEGGKAQMPYETSYTGELLSVRSQYQNCKVKACHSCQ